MYIDSKLTDLELCEVLYIYNIHTLYREIVQGREKIYSHSFILERVTGGIKYYPPPLPPAGCNILQVQVRIIRHLTYVQPDHIGMGWIWGMGGGARRVRG